jgi:rod shape-determining protein MreC
MSSFLQQNWRVGVLVLFIVGILALALGGYLGPALRVASTPLLAFQGWLSTRYLSIYESLRSPQDMAALRQKNAVLDAENSRLQGQVIQLQQQLKDSEVLYALLKFARARPNDTYVAASVIGRDPSPFLRYIMIDKGSDDGLRHGMPVVTVEGLVGRVDAVISNAARIQLVNDPGAVVNVLISSTRTEAVLAGSVTGDVQLGMVPLDITLKPGEVIITSALGGSYPAGILVGQVVGVRRLETELFQSASVQPVVDYNNLRAVLVVTNFSPVDITPLIPQDQTVP